MQKFRHFKYGVFPLLLLGMSFSSPSQAAETSSGSTRYVTDAIEIPMRSGAGIKYRIKRMLPSGQAVKLLEVDNDGWAKVLYKGSEGWMPANLLENQPVARDRLAEQIEKTTATEGRYNALRQELSTLQTRFDETSEELKTVKQNRFELTQELEHLKAVSTNAIELDQQNQAMKSRLSSLENENAIMREQIEQADDVIKRQWFLTGGGVLLLGLLLGRFFRVPQKRKKWGEI
jgi:SH3 domain protein